MTLVVKTLMTLMAVVALAYVAWRFWVRDTQTETFDAVQADGGPPLRVTIIESSRYYFGSGHWGYGGGDRRVEIEFVWQGRSLRWRSNANEKPWLLQRSGEAVFLVSETSSGSRDVASLVLYRRVGEEWRALPLEQLPANLAVCNLSRFGPRWTTGTWVAKDGREIRLVNDGIVQEKLDKLFRERER